MLSDGGHRSIILFYLFIYLFGPDCRYRLQSVDFVLNFVLIHSCCSVSDERKSLLAFPYFFLQSFAVYLLKMWIEYFCLGLGGVFNQIRASIKINVPQYHAMGCSIQTVCMKLSFYPRSHSHTHMYMHTSTSIFSCNFQCTRNSVDLHTTFSMHFT